MRFVLVLLATLALHVRSDMETARYHICIGRNDDVTECHELAAEFSVLPGTDSDYSMCMTTSSQHTGSSAELEFKYGDAEYCELYAFCMHVVVDEYKVHSELEMLALRKDCTFRAASSYKRYVQPFALPRRPVAVGEDTDQETGQVETTLFGTEPSYAIAWILILSLFIGYVCYSCLTDITSTDDSKYMEDGMYEAPDIEYGVSKETQAQELSEFEGDAREDHSTEDEASDSSEGSATEEEDNEEAEEEASEDESADEAASEEEEAEEDAEEDVSGEEKEELDSKEE